MNEIQELLINMSDISLEQMDCVRLMNRRDVKYVAHQTQLPDLLKRIAEKYRVLVIDNLRRFTYNTVYYDTAHLDMYLTHHNGKANRYKIRKRTYSNTNTTFLEIKRKTNRNWTFKNRRCLESLTDGECDCFIQTHSPYVHEDLNPALYNTFTRITLVSNELDERLTIDCDLSFSPDGIQWHSIHGLSVVEVKRDGYSRSSYACKVLKEMKMRENGLSKYCIGTALVNTCVKRNLMKEKFMRLFKFLRKMDGLHYESRIIRH